MNQFYEMLCAKNDSRLPRVIVNLEHGLSVEVAYEYYKQASALSVFADGADLHNVVDTATAALATKLPVIYRSIFTEYEYAIACALENPEQSAVMLNVEKLRRRETLYILDRLNQKKIEPVLEVGNLIEADMAFGFGARIICVNVCNFEDADLNKAGVLLRYIEERAPHVRTIFSCSDIEHLSYLTNASSKPIFRINKTYIDASPDAFLINLNLNGRSSELDAQQVVDAWKALTA